jgi:hypothetical protein
LGLFDEITCALLNKECGAGRVFKTCDTPAQYMDRYEINKDGFLWHERYDIEDHSDPNAQGMERLIGCMTRVPLGMESVDFSGEIRFYADDENDTELEFSAYFVRGRITMLVDMKKDKVLLKCPADKVLSTQA